MPLPVFLTTAEVALLLGKSEQLVEAMRMAGVGPPYYRLNRRGLIRVIYRKEEVEAWRAAQTSAAAGVVGRSENKA